MLLPLSLLARFGMVDWVKWASLSINLVALPLAAFVAWMRESVINEQKFALEARVRKETQERDDQLRREAQEREDRVRQEQYQREDAFRLQQRRIDLYTKFLLDAADVIGRGNALGRIGRATSALGQARDETTAASAEIMERLQHAQDAAGQDLQQIEVIARPETYQAARDYWWCALEFSTLEGDVGAQKVAELIEVREVLVAAIRDETQGKEDVVLQTVTAC